MKDGDQQSVQAALAWADRLQSGQEADRYDPWIVALANAYREQQQEIAALHSTLKISESEPDWRDAVDALHAAVQENERLTGLLKQLAFFDLAAAKHMTLDGTEFRVIGPQTARELSVLLDRAREATAPQTNGE